MLISKPVKNTKFYIYRNLHTGGFSIRHKGLVIQRSNYIIGNNVTFKVNELGRQRVIQEKRKNVHAFSVCESYSIMETGSLVEVDNLPAISYNPYKSSNFVCNNKTINAATAVLFFEGKCYLLDK